KEGQGSRLDRGQASGLDCPGCGILQVRATYGSGRYAAIRCHPDARDASCIGSKYHIVDGSSGHERTELRIAIPDLTTRRIEHHHTESGGDEDAVTGDVEAVDRATRKSICPG